MSKKIIISFLIIFIIIFSSSVTTGLNITEKTSKKVKFLAVGFFPETRGDSIVYYLLPGLIWAQVDHNNLMILWLGTFFILGISNIRPDYGFGKIP